MTNCVLTRKLLIPCLKFGAFYFSINFVQTKISGEPVYSFLDWKSINSLIIVLAIFLAISLLYIILCKLDETIKWDSFVRKNLAQMKKNKELKMKKN
jgi:hypothetical protein